VANIAFGLVDFTSSAVNFGFELDNGSTSEIHTSEYRNIAPVIEMRRSIGGESSSLANLLEDWDGIRLGGTLQRQTLSLRDLERTTFIDGRELGLRQANRLYKGDPRSRAKSMHLIERFPIRFSKSSFGHVNHDR